MFKFGSDALTHGLNELGGIIWFATASIYILGLIIPTFGNPSLGLHLGNCRVSPVEGGVGGSGCLGRETPVYLHLHIQSPFPHCSGCVVNDPRAMSAT